MKTILVVDDDTMSLTLVKDILTVNDYRVICLDDPSKCIDTLLAEKPDLTLLDIHMPVIDGFQLIKEIRTNQEISSAKVIALTASAMRGDQEKITKNGFNGYFSKPIQLQSFLEFIKEHIEK